jgi:hypothetical protein
MTIRTSLFALLCVAFAGSASAARIYVTATGPQIIGSGACSLPEAIYSSVLHDTLDGGAHPHGIAIDATDQDHFITTGCVMGDGDDTIVLPTDGVIKLSKDVDWDAYNPYGPTATPLIASTITIEGNGATLQWDPQAKGNVRLFAIGGASIKTPNGTASGIGSLTLRNVTVTGFHVKGGDGRNGGGGGLGAGGAIYLQNGSLTVEGSTFGDNGATGGNGGEWDGAGGGGGGLGGSGGNSTDGGGGGGGGARGDGGDGNASGGGGGGTVFAGAPSSSTSAVGGPGGYICGGNGGDVSDNGNDGHSGKCPGGGGGGSGEGTNPILIDFSSVKGGGGTYGGGGGGGVGSGSTGQDGNGGNGGFGGGGGGGTDHGGNGGFGGGGGVGLGFLSSNSGGGGRFGGAGADYISGGGGGALGGAIFSDAGTVTVRNSTFYGNFVFRGGSASNGLGHGENGSDAGGAIFSRNGDLTVQNSTFSGNQSTGSGAGVVAYMVSDDPNAFKLLTLDNTILADNGANECFVIGNVQTSGAGNLIMSNGSGSGTFGACPGVALTADPQLGPPQDNGGFTPTMAIPFNGIAMGAADRATSLATDQRGADRPQANGFDIGAYEVCRKQLLQLVEPFPCGETRFKGSATFPLTIDATAGGGSVSPAPGTYQAPANTVTALVATPNAGYYFNGWTGNVTSPGSASTTVIIDQAQSVVANFQLHDFMLSASPTSFTLPLGGATATSDVTATALGDFGDAITLAATGHPSGVAASLSANPVKPVAGTPVTSTLTIAVGPSAIPQSFTETITGQSTGLSGALSHPAQLSVTFVITADALVKIINQEQALGCIDKSGIAQSLIAKIGAYQTLAAGGHVQGAANVLAAFQYEVQSQIGRHIVTSCTDPVGGNAFSPGQALIADAQSLQAMLGTAVKAAPIVGFVNSTNDAGTTGRMVNLLSGKSVIATASTDAVGFYYLDTTALQMGAQYGVSVTIPKGYKASSPAVQTFTWTGKALQLATFTLN